MEEAPDPTRICQAARAEAREAGIVRLNVRRPDDEELAQTAFDEAAALAFGERPGLVGWPTTLGLLDEADGDVPVLFGLKVLFGDEARRVMSEPRADRPVHLEVQHPDRDPGPA